MNIYLLIATVLVGGYIVLFVGLWALYFLFIFLGMEQGVKFVYAVTAYLLKRALWIMQRLNGILEKINAFCAKLIRILDANDKKDS